MSGPRERFHIGGRDQERPLVEPITSFDFKVADRPGIGVKDEVLEAADDMGLLAQFVSIYVVGAPQMAIFLCVHGVFASRGCGRYEDLAANVFPR